MDTEARGNPPTSETDRETDRETVPARSLEPPTFRDRAISVALWGAGLSWLVPSLGTMSLVYRAVPSHRVNILGRIYCKVQIALTGNRWRAVVDPAVREETPYIFVQNHTNHFDHVMAYNATPHFKQGLELESHFDYPVYGGFMKARGTIGVRKGERGQTSSIHRGIAREIGAGRSVLAFPEGTRTTDGRVGRFRTGIFVIARDLGVPVVPVSVTGTFDMMRKGSLIIRPANQITVYCDAPIETAGASDDEIQEIADRARAMIAKRIDAYWEARR